MRCISDESHRMNRWCNSLLKGWRYCLAPGMLALLPWLWVGLEQLAERSDSYHHLLNGILLPLALPAIVPAELLGDSLNQFSIFHHLFDHLNIVRFFESESYQDETSSWWGLAGFASVCNGAIGIFLDVYGYYFLKMRRALLKMDLELSDGQGSWSFPL